MIAILIWVGLCLAALLVWLWWSRRHSGGSDEKDTDD